MNWIIENQYLSIYLYCSLVHLFSLVKNPHDYTDWLASFIACWFWPVTVPAKLLRKLLK